MKGKLYVVATPIGNLSDFSFRAIETLNTVDLIAAEDTRTSRVLLNKYNIKTKIVSNHKFNEISKVEVFIHELLKGKSIALITDAGTPCISDPGYILIREAVKKDIEILSIPGASAVVTALSLSGFEISSFSFYGFLPKDKKGIIKFLNEIKNDYSKVLVFYESPKRIIKTLNIIEEIFNDSKVCLCNDLTKKFEKIYRGSIKEVVLELKENKNHEKGEYTIVIEKNIMLEESLKDTEYSLESIIVNASIKNNCSIKEAIKILSDDKNKNELYKASLNLKKIIGKNK